METACKFISPNKFTFDFPPETKYLKNFVELLLFTALGFLFIGAIISVFSFCRSYFLHLSDGINRKITSFLKYKPITISFRLSFLFSILATIYYAKLFSAVINTNHSFSSVLSRTIEQLNLSYIPSGYLFAIFFTIISSLEFANVVVQLRRIVISIQKSKKEGQSQDQDQHKIWLYSVLYFFLHAVLSFISILCYIKLGTARSGSLYYLLISNVMVLLSGFSAEKVYRICFSFNKNTQQ